MTRAVQTDMQRSMSLLSATRQSRIPPEDYSFVEVERGPVRNNKHQRA